MSTGKKPILGYLAFLLLATVLIFASLYSYHLAREYTHHKAETLFRKNVEDTKDLVNRRLEWIESLLYAAQGLFAASQRVDRDEWAVFIGKLDIKKRCPGVVAMRYVERVPAANKADFEEKVRADKSLLLAGYPQFQIHPPGERDSYYVVKYVEPCEGNEPMLGLDLGFEPIRQETLERARDTGNPSLTKRVTLVVDPESPVPGFLMLLPLYRKGAPISTVQERQTALTGFVDAVIRAPNMFDDLCPNPKIYFKVFDGETLTKEHLIYDKSHQLPAVAPFYQPRFAAKKVIQFGGISWTFYYTSLPGFGLGAFEEGLPTRVLFGGLFFSFLLCAFVYAQMTLRRRAHLLAEKMSEEVKKSQARFEGIARIAEDAIVSVDENQKILFFNRGAEKVFGYSGDEVLGKPLEMLIPERFRGKHRKHIADFDASSANTRMMGIRSEIFGRRKDGTEFPAEANISKISFDHEKIFTAYLRDLTQRKRSEDALRRKTQQLEVVGEAMTSYLATGDWRESSARMVSGALKLTESEYGFIGVLAEGPTLRILAHEGIKWDKVVNQEFYQKALRDYKEKGYLEFRNFKNLFGSVLTTAKPVLSNEPARDPRSGGLPAGHPPLNHFLGVPILSGNECLGMIGVANRHGGYTETEQRDLEMLAGAGGVMFDGYRRQGREKGLEEQLRQSQKMDAIGRLAGGVAHDFNNLLTVIAGYADILWQKIQPNDSLTKEVDEIKKAAQRASLLTQQLLTFGRKQMVQPRVFELSKVVSDMDKMLKRMVGEDIEMETFLEAGNCRVKADVNQIEQVILNLVVNARDAMPQGGKLTIETRLVDIDEAYVREHVDVTPGTFVLLVVSDTGIGMDEKIQKRIFEPFFTTKEKGSGLGLSTVFGIVKQSGGNILVYSEPGKGTTFKVYLPYLKEPVQKEEKPKPATEKLVGTETILLVEDEEILRELAKTVLEMKGYRVLAAANGGEALRLGEQSKEPIHLILTDVVMPKMSGKQLADRIVPLHPEMKVLYMSGYTQNAIIHQGVVDSGIHFINKPFTPTGLARKVREVLDASK